MEHEYDAEREAAAALKFAADADAVDRQRWIRMASAWLELSRARGGTSPQRRGVRPLLAGADARRGGSCTD
jgi:hypothetical protein